MTSDQEFLQSARIVPDEIRETTWRNWRDEELRTERLRTAEAVRLAHAERMRGDALHKGLAAWKLAAFAGWFLAAAVMISGAGKP